MDITELLLQASTLLGLGMTFVFLFLGLLMVAVFLMAKYIPADKQVVNQRAVNKEAVCATSELNPKLVAAITSAVQQYLVNEVQEVYRLHLSALLYQHPLDFQLLPHAMQQDEEIQVRLRLTAVLQHAAQRI